MLLRQDNSDHILISQPAHAAVSAQLAHHWGNELFGSLQPADELRAAALLHDIGWIDWENKPQLNPETGLPYSFMQLPREPHLKMWEETAQQMMPFGRYATLLVSMHGTRLYNLVDYAQEKPKHLEMINVYLATEQQLQNRLTADLQNDPAYAPFATAELIAKNSQLIANWDWLSLLLCHRITRPREVANVPTADSQTVLTLKPITREASETVSIAPWPFSTETVPLQVEGKRITGSFADQITFDQAFVQAPTETVKIKLVKSD